MAFTDYLEDVVSELGKRVKNSMQIVPKEPILPEIPDLNMNGQSQEFQSNLLNYIGASQEAKDKVSGGENVTVLDPKFGDTSLSAEEPRTPFNLADDFMNIIKTNRAREIETGKGFSPGISAVETLWSQGEEFIKRFKEVIADPSAGKVAGTVWSGVMIPVAPYAGVLNETGKVPVIGTPLNLVEGGMNNYVFPVIDKATEIEPDDQPWEKDIKAAANEIVKDVAYMAVFAGLIKGAKVTGGKIKYKNVEMTRPEIESTVKKMETGEAMTPKENVIKDYLGEVETRANVSPKEFIEKAGEMGQGKFRSVEIPTERALIKKYKAEATSMWKETFNKELPQPIKDVMDSSSTGAEFIVENFKQKFNEYQVDIGETRMTSFKDAIQTSIPKGTIGLGGDMITEPDLPMSDSDLLKVEGNFKTRNIKQTDEFRGFVDYAQELTTKDISGPASPLTGHLTLTAERVAEKLDGQIHGRVYKEIVEPVFNSREMMAEEGHNITKTIKSFGIIPETKLAREASLVAQNKIKSTNKKAIKAAEGGRVIYNDLISRMNAERYKLGLEPIPKRKDYVTHVNEINTLAEVFGGVENISREKAIKQVQQRLINDGIEPDVAFQRAKRKIEGSTGLERYIDAKQPIFKFAKERLSEYEANPDLINSLNAYINPALRYIHQAENVAKNKAFKDVLPQNAKNFIQKWNTEQVAGLRTSNIFNPTVSKQLKRLRNTIGQNTILGNAGTTALQLTSFPQVVALAGPVNTAYGIASRIGDLVTGGTSLYDNSRTKKTRELGADIGLGDTYIDSLLETIGKYESMKDGAAKTRFVFKLGRNFLGGILQAADSVTVGASFNAFYRKATTSGLEPGEAVKYADTMTGKTQANYFPEALPPSLGTGDLMPIIGQFGTYSYNQWEMMKNDIGKEYINEDGEFKSKRDARTFTSQVIYYITSAYIIDSISDKLFGRQPIGIKDFADALFEGDWDKALTAGRQMFTGYIPFLSSAKFGSPPPVADFIGDTLLATGGEGAKQQKAIDDLQYKWPWLLLFPAGGNQAKKTLQAVEATTGVDIPLIKDVTKTAGGKTRFDLDGWSEQMSALLFGVYSTAAAREYYEEGGTPKATKKSKRDFSKYN